MSAIIIDTETTGLLEAEGNPLENQPYIIEVYAMRISDNYKPECHFHSLVKPPKPLPEHITKITRIREQDLKAAPVFAAVYRPLAELFLGCHTTVAHNATFDLGVLYNELKRIDKHCRFPFTPVVYCTVEQSMHLRGYRLKLQELYEMATGKPEIPEAHRAENDVMALLECYKWLRGQK